MPKNKSPVLPCNWVYHNNPGLRCVYKNQTFHEEGA